MEINKVTAVEQAEYALLHGLHGDDFELQCALERILIEYNDLIEECAKRVDAYGLSLELQRHIGLPGPIDAVGEAAKRIRAISSQ